MYAYFLVLVAQYTENYHPSWNFPLWEKSLTTLWHWTNAAGPVEISWNDIRRLICVKGDLALWYRGIHCYPEYRDREIGYKEEDWRRFFESCLREDTVWASEFLSQTQEQMEEYRKGLRNRERLIDTFLLTDYMWKWKEGQLAVLKEMCRFRIFEFKEELIATGWHPDRMPRWCLDWEEREDMKKMWADFE
jgi:hypothetical protein